MTPEAIDTANIAVRMNSGETLTFSLIRDTTHGAVVSRLNTRESDDIHA
jgi:hypothetical protein